MKTTFFVVSAWAEQYPDTAKAIVEAGHELENHSSKHDHYNSLTADQIVADVTKCNESITKIAGKTPTLIRCPFGEYDDHVISAIRSMGMEPIQWDVERYHTPQGGGRKGLREHASLATKEELTPDILHLPLHLFQSQLVVIPHTDIFLYLPGMSRYVMTIAM